MNKYEKSLNNIIKCWHEVEQNHFYLRDALNLLELVEKATPTIPTNQFEIDFGLGNVGECVCGQEVNYQQIYCDKCGQKIDWSDNN